MLQRATPGGRLQAVAGLRARTTQRVAARPSSSQDGSSASNRPLDCFASPLKAGAMTMTSERTAIVTGAGKRVGAEIARALLDDGWSVVAHVHHEADDPPAGSVKVVADLTDLSCAETIFEVTRELPPVRLVVNNAARFAWDDLGRFDPVEFNAHMEINVRAPALLAERFARQHDGADGLI